MKKKTLVSFAGLLSALYDLRKDGRWPEGIAPEVQNQVDTIEKCLYGLLDRMAFCQVDRKGRPMFLGRRAAGAYRAAIEAVRGNEGEDGNSRERWFNILTDDPGGTLDGVLHAEKGLK